MARRASILFTASALALGLATSAHAACPRLIMISGEPLPEPMVISDWDAACRLYSLFFNSPPAGATRLDGRPSLRLGLFWHGPSWEPYVGSGRLGELEPTQANQVGRFYPAVGGKPALVDLPGYGDWPKLVNGAALRTLEDRGVDTRLDSGMPWITIGQIGSAVVAVTLLLLVLRSRRA